MELNAGIIAEWVEGTVEGSPSQVIRSVSKIEELVPESLCFMANGRYEKYMYQDVNRAILVSKDFIPQKGVTATMIKVDNVYDAFGHILNRIDGQNNNHAYTKKAEPIAATAQIGDDCQIGHFVIIGENSVIEDQVVLADQVFIGNDVHIGKGTILHPGVKIMDGCRIGAEAVIFSNAVIGSAGFGFSQTEEGYKRIPQKGNVVIEDKVEIGANSCIDRASIGSTVIGRGAKIDNLVQIAHNVKVGEHVAIAAQSGVSGSASIGDYSQLGGQSGVAGHIKLARGTRIQAQSGVPSDIVEEGGKWYGYPIMKYFDYLRSYALFKRLPELLKRIEQLEKKSD